MDHHNSPGNTSELLVLCAELCNQIKQQLTYYRASVYKTEITQTITTKITDIEFAAAFLDDPQINEAFSDYKALNHRMQITLDGDSFMIKVSHLLNAVEQELVKLFEPNFQRSLHNRVEINVKKSSSKNQERLKTLFSYSLRMDF